MTITLPKDVIASIRFLKEYTEDDLLLYIRLAAGDNSIGGWGANQQKAITILRDYVSESSEHLVNLVSALHTGNYKAETTPEEEILQYYRNCEEDAKNSYKYTNVAGKAATKAIDFVLKKLEREDILEVEEFE